MDAIRTYLISVVAAAIISAIVLRLTDSKNAYSGLIRLLTGVFLSITVISPLAKITLTDVNAYFDGLEYDTESVVSNGTNSSKNAMAEIIKENTEAYILDKAFKLGLDIEVQVHLSDGVPPIPQSVCITGAVAPYLKTQLQQIIENDLAISKENQTWS